MKKLWAVCLTLCVTISLTVTTAFATELKLKTIEEQMLCETVEAYLTSVAENMWLYESNDLTAGTVVEYLAVTAEKGVVANDEKKLSESSAKAVEKLFESAKEITFVENKTEYFKELRQAQDIQRNEFHIEYELIDIDIDDQEGEVKILESISFRYPDFPDTLSEVISEYAVKLIFVDGQWLVADVTALNDWFDDAFKEDGFDAENPEKSFGAMEAKVEAEYAQLENAMNANVVEDETIALAANSTLYSYNRANAAAYAYTYTTSAYNTVVSQTDAQKRDARTYWNQLYAQYGPNTDCMNLASQSIWVGFGGSNTSSSISSHAAPMDTSGDYKWYGTTRGNEYSGDVPPWRSCGNFRSYLSSEAGTSMPDMYVDRYTLTGSQQFSAYSGITTSNLIGAILHVNSGGHAIVVTDASDTKRASVLFTAHTSDRKGVKISEYWNSGTIYVMIPQSIRVYNPANVRITATLFRPAPVNSILSLSSGANTICSSINVTITSPTGRTATNNTTNTSANRYNYKFTEKGLYKITTTAKKTASSAAQTYVYTVRIY